MSLQESPKTAIQVISSAEEPGNLPTLPPLKNFASNAGVVEYIRSAIAPLMRWCRDNRRALEEEWHAIDRMELMQHDEGQSYTGRSNVYVPGYLRALSTLTSALSRGLFPSDDFIEVTSREGRADAAAEIATKRLIQWDLMENAQIRRFLKPALKSHQSLGNGVVKYWYHKPPKGGFKTGRRNLLRQLQATEVGFGDYNQSYCEGTRVSARSMYNVFVYPVTAESQDDLTLVFEDVDVSADFLREREHLKQWENVQEALERGAHSDNQNTQQTLTDANVGTDPVQAANSNMTRRYRIQDIYTYMVLPRTEYLPDEDPALPLPAHIVMCGDVILLAKRNENWHQQIPYRFIRQNVTPGMFYGYGAGRAGRGLQYLANDFTNQANDVATYCLNPMWIIDETYLPGPLSPIKPGGAWSTTDINKAIKSERPPVELINPAMMMKQDALGQLQDMTGAPAILQGLNAGKGAKTATSSQILQANATGPLQDQVEDIEYDLLIPLMLGTWKNNMQWREQAVMLRVGGEAIQVTLQDIAINAEMRWLASSQIVNKQQRAQMAMQFLQTLISVAPIMQAQGKMVDPTFFLRKAAADFGFRDFDKSVIAVPQMPMGGEMGGPPQGGPPEEGDRVRSAVEQASGGQPGELPPGDGGEFMNVRQEADQMAAPLGYLGEYGPVQQ